MRTLTASVLAGALALSGSPALAVTVSGGGPTSNDCSAGFDVTTDNPTVSNTAKSFTAKACSNSCTFQVSACVGLSEPAGCTPAALSSLKSGPLAKPATLGPDNACGAPSTIVVKTKKNGKKKNARVLKVKGRLASGTPKNDIDILKLTCLPNLTNDGCGGTTTTTIPGSCGTCPANPQGGPSNLVLTIGPTGTDLDNGWTGSSHNFILVPNGKIDGCLTNCDGASDNDCDFFAQTGPGTGSGELFGAPLPLLTSNVPVCVVSKWRDNINGTVNPLTGKTELQIKLTSEVYLTDVTSVCPQCKNGKCNSGANSGKSCQVEASVDVFISQGNKDRYDLSSTCTPLKPEAAALKIDFAPLTTEAAATLTGPTPCKAQPGEPTGLAPQPDACGAGGCGAPCTGLACLSKIDDPIHPGTQVCIDSKGGVSQLCCNSNTAKPCFTLANGGTVNRSGFADPPTEVTPGTGYPKHSSKGVLAATFCIPATGKSSIDQVTGLPGPGAIQLTGTADWCK